MHVLAVPIISVQVMEGKSDAIYQCSEPLAGRAALHIYGSSTPPVGLSSWAIRFVALLGLSRVCRVCSKMHLKDGMSALAWSRLVEAHATERDSRVMEAYKTRQVGVCVR